MEDLGTLTIVWRVALTLFVIVAPTLLFLGLIRGLEYLRDDALVEQYAADAPDYEDGNDVLRTLTEGTPLDAGELNTDGEHAGSSDPGSTAMAHDLLHEAGETSPCAHCGTVNREDVTYCRHCLEPIE